MEFHEIANIFPLLVGKEHLSLRDDIAQNGLIEPIWLYEGKILDGRNRYIACLDLGIEPKYREYSGSDPQQFVLSMNLHRRHLNETQRAIIASRLANMPLGGAVYRSANLPTDGITQPSAAKMLNVSERTVRNVKAVERDAPELVPEMEAGKMSSHEAIRILRRRKQLEQVKYGNCWLVG